MASTLRAEGTVLSPLAQIPQAPDPSVITSLVFSFSLDNSLSDAVSSLGLREHGLHETDSVLPHTMIPDADKQTLVDQHATVVRAHAPRSGWVGGSPDPSVALLLAASSGLVFLIFLSAAGAARAEVCPLFFPSRAVPTFFCSVMLRPPGLCCYVMSVLCCVVLHLRVCVAVCLCVSVCLSILLGAAGLSWAESRVGESPNKPVLFPAPLRRYSSTTVQQCGAVTDTLRRRCVVSVPGWHGMA